MKSLKKYYKLQASPEDVYNAMTNPVMLEIWTGEKAEFSTEPNTEFSLWDGAITGINRKCVTDKSIEQTWFFEEIESTVIIKLHPDKEHTSVELRQDNIPEEAYENMVDGWNEDYFASLADLFNE